MCIIKILIDKGVRAWPQYRRRTHACTQIHMMTGGAAEMKGLRRKRGANSFYWSGISAISDAPQQKSRGRLRDLQPAPPTLSCICVWLHFHYWTAERIIGTTLSTLQELYSSRVRKGAGKITLDPAHPARSLCVTVWSTLQSSEHQNDQTQEQYEMCQHHESVEKNIYIKYRGRFIYLLDK